MGAHHSGYHFHHWIFDSDPVRDWYNKPCPALCWTCDWRFRRWLDFSRRPHVHWRKRAQGDPRTLHWVHGMCCLVNYGISLDITSPTDSTKWRVPFALQMLPGAFLLVGMLFMNESPRWLVEKNKLSQAAKALAHVRGKSVEDPEVIQELDEIIADFNGHEKMPMVGNSGREQTRSTTMLLRSSSKLALLVTRPDYS